MEPTDKKIQEFWERVGFEKRYLGGQFIGWKYPNGEHRLKLPLVHPNSLFKYAVPKVIEVLDKETLNFEFRYRRITLLGKWVWIFWVSDAYDSTHHAINEDPADALFEVCYKALGGKE